MRPDDTEQAAQAVQRLNHRRDHGRVRPIAGKNLAYLDLETADQILGLLLLLIGHVVSST